MSNHFTCGALSASFIPRKSGLSPAARIWVMIFHGIFITPLDSVMVVYVAAQVRKAVQTTRWLDCLGVRLVV